MGMDVYGRAPTGPAGESRRENVWGWHPLWDYCVSLAPDLAGKVNHGHSNDGDGLDAADSKKLAAVIRSDIASGGCARYQEARAAYLAALPHNRCGFCNATGYRDDKIGRDIRRHHPEFKCNACGGAGNVADPRTHYRFSVESAAEFAEFLQDCGGFEIR